MLIYYGKGTRNYFHKPLEIQRRKAWEFQASLGGKIAPQLADGHEDLKSLHLWVFPPEHPHGWIGAKGEEAEILVFHFISAPELLHHLLGKKKFFEVKLGKENVERLRELSKNVAKYWNNPAPGMMICYEHALMELSLMVCEAHASETSDVPRSFAQGRVQAAIKWFAQRLEENPSQEQMAQAVSVSPAHLRRLFHLVLQTSPKQMMDQLRFQRATMLMSDMNMKFEEISEKCGFSSASAFSRAFKIKFGCSPEAWRGKK